MLSETEKTANSSILAFGVAANRSTDTERKLNRAARQKGLEGCAVQWHESCEDEISTHIVANKLREEAARHLELAQKLQKESFGIAPVAKALPYDRLQHTQATAAADIAAQLTRQAESAQNSAHAAGKVCHKGVSARDGMLHLKTIRACHHR